MGIEIKSAREIDAMRQSGRIVGKVLRILSEQIRPGMKTKELDTIAVREMKKLGAESSFLGYRGYPANVCVSVNDEIVHGIPGERVLREGDIVSLDFGVVYRGYHGDAAVTVGVGQITPKAQRLIETTRDALDRGIEAARAGGNLGDISAGHPDLRGVARLLGGARVHRPRHRPANARRPADTQLHRAALRIKTRRRAAPEKGHDAGH